MNGSLKVWFDWAHLAKAPSAEAAERSACLRAHRWYSALACAIAKTIAGYKDDRSDASSVVTRHPQLAWVCKRCAGGLWFTNDATLVELK